MTLSLNQNGILRCYNLFPSDFDNIDAMTAYLPTLKKMGMNAVWLNPIQVAGLTSMHKTDSVTGVTQNVSKSIYAMRDTLLVDQRFSVIKINSDGEINPTSTQLSILSQQLPVHSVVDVKTLIGEINQARKNYQLAKSNYDAFEKETLALLNEMTKLASKHGSIEIKQIIVPALKKATYPRADFVVELSEAQKGVLNAAGCELPVSDKTASLKSILTGLKQNTLKDAIEQYEKYEFTLAQMKTQLVSIEETYLKKQKLQDNMIQILDDQALKTFCATARSLGLTPMFDLVTNHVAKDAPIAQEHQNWFGEDQTYPDATCFKYADMLNFESLKNEALDVLISKDSELLSPLRNHIYQYSLTDKDKALIDSSEKLSLEEKEQLKTKVRYKSSKAQRDEAEKIIATVADKFWDPFIQRYVDLGFSGARVDCVRKVPAQLRSALYTKLREKVKQRDNGEQVPIVILEEALFSDLSPKQFEEIVKGAQATHITASVFNSKREWDGAIKSHSEEEFYKKRMVTAGVINFTGNHDHYSCAMKACHLLAEERFKKSKTLQQLYTAEFPKTESQIQIRNTIFLHSFIRQIIEELKNPNQYHEECVRFAKVYRDMMLTHMFLGSSGYYMLSGDEFASLRQPTVFTRDNGQPLYPKNAFSFFVSTTDPLYSAAQSVLQEMALELAEKSSDKIVKQTIKTAREQKKTNSSDVQALLSAFKEQIKNEVNANVTKTLDVFMSKLKTAYFNEVKKLSSHKFNPFVEQATLQLTEEKLPKKAPGATSTATTGANKQPKLTDAEIEQKFYDLLNAVYGNPFNHLSMQPLHSQTDKFGGERPDSLAPFANEEFIGEMNAIMDRLPRSENGFWSEIFKRGEEDILVTVRKNGPGYDSPTDIIITNLNPHKTYDIDKQELVKIALWFQKRGFGDRVDFQDPEFSKAYGTIMGNMEYKLKPANLYFAGRLTVNQDVKDYKLTIDGKEQGFNIVVSPKPLSPSILLQTLPTDFIFEEEESKEKLAPTLPATIPGTDQAKPLTFLFDYLSLEDAPLVKPTVQTSTIDPHAVVTPDSFKQTIK